MVAQAPRALQPSTRTNSTSPSAAASAGQVSVLAPLSKAGGSSAPASLPLVAAARVGKSATR